MSEKLEAYLEKRVKALLAENWEHSRIIQQLVALCNRKKIEQLIAKVLQ